MIVDTSALVAILLKEPEKQAIQQVMADCPVGELFIAAPTYLEAYIVMFKRNGHEGIASLKRLVEALGIITEPFDNRHFVFAIQGYFHFNGAPAKLNFGDCFSYALAVARNEPLLCKGGDFKHTNIMLVEY